MAWVCAPSVSGCASTRAVEEGQVYRAAPQPAAELAQTISSHQVRSVVNLQGFHPGQAWYRQQREAAQQAGAEWIDLSVRSDHLGSGDVNQLVQTFQRAPRPILLLGSSRNPDVDFAAALYRRAISGDSPQRARQEFAPWFRTGWTWLPGADQTELVNQWDGPVRAPVAALPGEEPLLLTAWSDEHSAAKLPPIEPAELPELDESPASLAEASTSRWDLVHNPLVRRVRQMSRQISLGIDDPNYRERFLAQDSHRIDEGAVFDNYDALIIDSAHAESAQIIGRVPRRSTDYVARKPSSAPEAPRPLPPPDVPTFVAVLFQNDPEQPPMTAPVPETPIVQLGSPQAVSSLR